MNILSILVLMDLLYGGLNQIMLKMLKNFSNLRFDEKCLLINLMNILPILVLMNLLYGELNQIMLSFPFVLIVLIVLGGLNLRAYS